MQLIAGSITFPGVKVTQSPEGVEPEKATALEEFKQLGAPSLAETPAAACREFKRGLGIELYCGSGDSTQLPFLNTSATFQEDDPPAGLVKYSSEDLQKVEQLTQGGKCSNDYVLSLFGYLQPTEAGLYKVTLIADAKSAVMMIDGKQVVRLQEGGVPYICMCK